MYTILCVPVDSTLHFPYFLEKWYVIEYVHPEHSALVGKYGIHYAHLPKMVEVLNSMKPFQPFL